MRKITPNSMPFLHTPIDIHRDYESKLQLSSIASLLNCSAMVNERYIKIARILHLYHGPVQAAD